MILLILDLLEALLIRVSHSYTGSTTRLSCSEKVKLTKSNVDLITIFERVYVGISTIGPLGNWVLPTILSNIILRVEHFSEVYD